MSIHRLDNQTRNDLANRPLLVDANHAAGLLGIGRTTFFALVKNGVVFPVRLGGCVRYSTTDLADLVDSLRASDRRVQTPLRRAS